MASLSINSWNCRGLNAGSANTQLKMDFLESHFSSRPFDILGLVETHHRNEDHFPPLIREYALTHHLSHTPMQASDSCGGIVVVYSKLFTVLDTSVPLPGRILTLTLQHSITQVEYLFTFYYGLSPQQHTSAVLQAAMVSLGRQHSYHTNSFILGDFNFVEEDIDRPSGLNRWDRRILPFWHALPIILRDSFRFLKPRTRIYSFHMKGLNVNSRIDRIYVPEFNLPHVRQFQYVHTPFFDHKLQHLTFATTVLHGPGTWKMNTSILTDPLYHDLITDLLLNMAAPAFPTKIMWWDVFLLTVKTLTIQYCARKHHIRTALHRSLALHIEQLQALPQYTLFPLLTARLAALQDQLRRLQLHQIQGHILRSRIPRFEVGEPHIQHYAMLEKYHYKKNIIPVLRDEQGDDHSSPADLLAVAYIYYATLYTPTPLNTPLQADLLSNLTPRLTAAQRIFMDSPITLAELTQAVLHLPVDKSPGLDGIPIEFYQQFWPELKDHFFQYISQVSTHGFSAARNVGVAKLLYKEKGDPADLAFYRPLTLLNCDVKIFTKTLATRLHTVLPSIIHSSQTGVHGRRIDHTIHTIRDLIELTEKNADNAAFIFLDQEKAFDRVNHLLLFKVMRHFGFGPTFLSWVSRLYGNATTRVMINGFLTDKFSVLRGVRQGCPLSPLLYVFIIEILAAQLRANPNIVGFTVGGEKIVSLHYADDATITITQNECFKEVYKELSDFAAATGAKINASKTTGLWVGGWKNRPDAPLPFLWCSSNVKNLGVFLGTDDPAKATFDAILPKLRRSLQFWMSFSLCKLAKARILEIFIASKLWYAARFYPMSPAFTRLVQKLFFDFINHPRRLPTVSQQELIKLRHDGGIKLIDVATKSRVSKCMWLIQLITNPAMAVNLSLVTHLLGETNGHKRGIDIFFCPSNYASHNLRHISSFYKEAITAFTKFDLQQHAPRTALPLLTFLYSRIFLDRDYNAIRTTLRARRRATYFLYCHFLAEKLKADSNQPADAPIVAIYERLEHIAINSKEHAMLTSVYDYLPLHHATESQLYTEAISSIIYRDHHSTLKWQEFMSPVYLVWKDIWRNVHNPLASEYTKSIIWEQLHLNFYTTHSFNKWRDATDPCPFCNQVPDSAIHVIVQCPFVRDLWTEDFHPFLNSIHSAPVTDYEMAFGLDGHTAPILLRNWMTFLFRQVVSAQEGLASQTPGLNNARLIQTRMNRLVPAAVHRTYEHCCATNTLPFFAKHFQFLPDFVVIHPDDFGVLTVFNL